MPKQLIALLAVAMMIGNGAHAGDAHALDVLAGTLKPYLLDSVTRSLSAVRTMRERVDANDLAGAQQAWLAAREGWEGSEVVTNEFFPDLDRAIDAWPDAEKGFHAVEARLFGAHDVRVAPATAELVGNLEEYKRQLQQVTLTAQGLLNGTAKLVYEVGEDKAQGGESPFSGDSLAEIRDNLRCIRTTWQRVFAAAVRNSDASLAASFNSHLQQLQSVASAPTLQQLDQITLRDASESLANDVVMMARVIGLQRPQLGN
jgi:iron uptake system component EfeO